MKLTSSRLNQNLTEDASILLLENNREINPQLSSQIHRISKIHKNKNIEDGQTLNLLVS